jgi:uncharacterized membrane protein
MRFRLRPLLAVAAVVVFLVAARPAPAVAQEPEPLSVWTYSLYKTITYEFFANLADIPLYAWVAGVPVAGTGLFTAVNVTTAAAAYYVHEVLWNVYGPPMQESAETALEVGIEKVIVYRVVSTARNVVLIYAFGGTLSANITFALLSNVVDATIYAANEYGWYAFGPPVETLQGKSVVRSVPVSGPQRHEPVFDLLPASAVVTAAATEVRRGAVSLKSAAVAMTDGLAAGISRIWSSLP